MLILLLPDGIVIIILDYRSIADVTAIPCLVPNYDILTSIIAQFVILVPSLGVGRFKGRYILEWLR